MIDSLNYTYIINVDFKFGKVFFLNAIQIEFVNWKKNQPFKLL